MYASYLASSAAVINLSFIKDSVHILSCQATQFAEVAYKTDIVGVGQKIKSINKQVM